MDRNQKNGQRGLIVGVITVNSGYFIADPDPPFKMVRVRFLPNSD